MFDRNNNKISEGDFLRDVRFGTGSYVRVTEIVYNVKVIGVFVHRKYHGGWNLPYNSSALCTNSVFEIVPADKVPAQARELLTR